MDFYTLPEWVWILGIGIAMLTGFIGNKLEDRASRKQDKRDDDRL